VIVSQKYQAYLAQDEHAEKRYQKFFMRRTIEDFHSSSPIYRRAKESVCGAARAMSPV
jgi:hypothetical protein